MYLVVKQQLKHLSKCDYEILRELCHISKNLRNQVLYEARQQYFKDETYLPYQEVYKILKSSENYKLLNSNMAQQIMKAVDAQFQSFFGSLSAKKAGRINHKVNIPHYLPKDGYAQLIVQQIRIKDNVFTLPYSVGFKKNHKLISLKIPSVLEGKQIKEIKITPMYNARFFEISYAYEAADVEKEDLDKTAALAIDLGVNNFCTCATSRGDSFIVDGRKLKSINQWYNKENSRLQGIKDKQKYGKTLTERQSRLARKRANRIRDYLGKTAKMIIQYCLKNRIGNLVIGKNKGFQQGSGFGKVNNQNFVNIPYYQLEQKLTYQCKMHGINLVLQEESYTSKADFWSRDEIPVWEGESHNYKFSGKRIKRGMYCSAKGKMINADVNGALNILRKSNVVSLEALYSRGELNTPMRIRVA